MSALQGGLQLSHVVLRLLQPLDQVVVHFPGDRVVLGAFNRCDVLDVLDNRLILGAQIFVESFDESTGVHAARFHARRRAQTRAGGP